MTAGLASSKIEPIIFSLCLTDPKYTSFIEQNVKLDWFDDNQLSKILKGIIAYFNKYASLPNKHVLDLIICKIFHTEDEQKQILNKVNTILSNEYVGSEYIDEQILIYVKHIGGYNIIIDSIDDIENKKSIEGCIEPLQKITSLTFDADDGHDFLEESEEYIEYLQTPNSTISTGWGNVDEIMNGGLPADGRCLAMWMGETHIGKSLFLSNLASNLLKDNKFVVLVTLEMSEYVYSHRITAHLTEGDVNTLKQNIDSIRNTVSTLRERFPNSKLVLKEFPPDSVNCNCIQTYIDKLKAKHGRSPDCIIVDYLNLLMPNGKEESGTYLNVGRISKQLRALSYKYKAPVVSVTQVNRSGYGNTDIDFSSVSESINVPQNLDFLAAIYQNEGDKDLGVIHNKILKNRFGGKIGKNLTFEINYKNLTIRDVNSRVDITDCDNVANSIITDLEMM